MNAPMPPIINAPYGIQKTARFHIYRKHKQNDTSEKRLRGCRAHLSLL